MGIKGRDVMQLLRVLPGVTTLTVVPWGEISDTDPAGTGSNGGQFGSFTPAVGGARLFWNTVTVDGQVGSNPDFAGMLMQAQSMDAIAEMKLVSNNYTAEYGRNLGSTVALVSKSGTKDFHGTVYGYKRSEKLNANDFFNNRTASGKARSTDLAPSVLPLAAPSISPTSSTPTRTSCFSSTPKKTGGSSNHGEGTP